MRDCQFLSPQLFLNIHNFFIVANIDKDCMSDIAQHPTWPNLTSYKNEVTLKLKFNQLFKILCIYTDYENL